MANGHKEETMDFYHSKFWESLLDAARPGWSLKRIGDTHYNDRRSRVWVLFGALRFGLLMFLLGIVALGSGLSGAVPWLELTVFPFLAGSMVYILGHNSLEGLAQLMVKFAWWRLMGARFDYGACDQQLRELALQIKKRPIDRPMNELPEPYDQWRSFEQGLKIAQALEATTQKDYGAYVDVAQKLGA